VHPHTYADRPSKGPSPDPQTRVQVKPRWRMKPAPPNLPILFFLSFAALLPRTGGNAHAEEKFTLSGTIKNAENGEALIGAYVVIRNLKKTGASTNAYGFYSLTIPSGHYGLLVQYPGYRVLSDSVDLTRDRVLNFSLTPEPITVGEVVVSGERSDKNVTSTVMSSNKLEMREVTSIPVLPGEMDILRTIQRKTGGRYARSPGPGGPGIDSHVHSAGHRSDVQDS